VKRKLVFSLRENLRLFREEKKVRRERGRELVDKQL
jgi:hypothetical protein